MDYFERKRAQIIEQASSETKRERETWQQGRSMLYGHVSAIAALQQKAAEEGREATPSELLEAMAMIAYGLCIVFDEVSEPAALQREKISRDCEARLARLDKDEAQDRRSKMT